MSKELFTADGVTRKFSELNALPEPDLKRETDAIRSDFQSWMFINFDLNADQAGYLDGMDPVFSRTLSADVADCIEYHLPIFVSFPPPPPTPPTGSKFVQPRSSLVRIYDPIKGYIVTGQLTIVIEYK